MIDMEPVTVVITDYDFPDLDIERKIITDAGANVHATQVSTPDEILELDVDPDVLLVQYAEVTEEVYERFENLKAVGVYGIGVDNIDVETASKHGIKVVNVPSYCEDEVAEHALALMLACERKIPCFDAETSRGNWNWKEGKPMSRLKGQTLGIIGFGKIGRMVARKTSGLGFETLVYDPDIKNSDVKPFDVERAELEPLLSESDIVTVHTPLTEVTEHLLDSEAFRTMKESSTLINTSRGRVVDTDDLYQALSNNELRAAALDVLPEEPPGDDSLLNLDNVVVTPHVAWYSEQSIATLRQTIAEDLVRILRNGEARNVING